MLIMIDLDNTIGDRQAAVERWVDEFCRTHSLTLADRDWLIELDNDGYSAREEVFAAIRERFDLTEPVDQLLQHYRTRVVELTTPVAGARDALISMRTAGHQIAIVTNGSSGQQHGKIDRLKFRELVDAVVVSGDLDIKKPDRRIFDATAAATGAFLDDAWMIGDSAMNDVVGPQAIGVRTVWISRNRPWPAEHSPPTAIINTLNELAAVLR